MKSHQSRTPEMRWWWRRRRRPEKNPKKMMKFKSAEKKSMSLSRIEQFKSMKQFQLSHTHTFSTWIYLSRYFCVRFRSLARSLALFHNSHSNKQMAAKAIITSKNLWERFSGELHFAQETECVCVPQSTNMKQIGWDENGEQKSKSISEIDTKRATHTQITNGIVKNKNNNRFFLMCIYDDSYDSCTWLEDC